MLPVYIDKLTEIRLRLMPIIGHGVYRWDKETRQLAKASPYLFFTWIGGLWASLAYCGLHGVTLYYKIKGWERIEDVVENVKDPQEFATIVLQWAEMISATLLVILIFLILDRREEIMYVMNQLLIYDRNLMETLKSKQLGLDDEQKHELRTKGVQVLVSSIGTVVAPMVLVFIVFHPLEPTRVLVEDILEVHMSFSDVLVNPYFYVVIMPPCFAGLYGGGNAIYITTHLTTWYYLVTKGALMDVTPTADQQNWEPVGVGNRRNTTRLKLQVEKYGLVPDDEIIKTYRTLQLFNCLMNEIFSSFAMAFHHTAILIAVCAMAYFTIKMRKVISLMGIIVLAGAMFFLLTIEYMECDMFGMLQNVSDNFAVTGVKATPRCSLYRKFLRSCPVFYVQMAYPFYTINKMTFAEFWDQMLDKTIMLLLW